MRDFLILFVHVIVTLARLARPGGLRSVVAESVLVRHQLLVLNRGRKRAPNLRARGSHHRRLVHPLHTPGAGFLFRHRSEACHSAPSPECAAETKVPLVVFARAQASAWSKRTEERPYRRGRRDETAQSALGLSPHCPADRVGLRRRDRQGCCSPHLERSLPPGIRFRRSFLAYISWPDQGQLVELRFIPLRIGNPENTLGSRRNGPIYTSHHRLRRSRWHRGWCGTVPHVPASDSRSPLAKIPQLGS